MIHFLTINVFFVGFHMTFHPSPSKVNTLLDKDLATWDGRGVSVGRFHWFFLTKRTVGRVFFETGSGF